MRPTDPLLAATRLLDFQARPIAALIAARGWKEMPPHARIGSIYDFVRNEILFGYNRADDIPASQVLTDGYGQCNTKATLLMALLRGVGIRCRLHGFTIRKALQRGVVPELVYPMAPAEILHSWVEVEHADSRVILEGFILDQAYLTVLQNRFANSLQALCGYGVGTECLSAPPVIWTGGDTFIQRTGISADLGMFDTPDDFYVRHRQEFGAGRAWLYSRVIRHWMNGRVRRIRKGSVPMFPGIEETALQARALHTGGMADASHRSLKKPALYPGLRLSEEHI